MNTTTWLDYVTAIGAVATPILVLILTAVGWRIRKRLERRIELEDKLREDRISAYNQILQPFIILLTSEVAWKTDTKNRNKDKNEIAMQKLLSLEYREQGFRLSLVGSDEVVTAYNNLMQFFFQRRDSNPTATESDVKDMMKLLGCFLLEIRKSMGNESTKLDTWDMLEWFLTDARSYRGWNPNQRIESRD